MITIEGYGFEGPYSIGQVSIDRASIYAILDVNNSVVDVGQSGETGTRLENHERKACWDRNGGRWVAIRWMPSFQYSREDRERLENLIRLNAHPLCGVR